MRYIRKSFLGILFSYRWLARVKFKMAGDLNGLRERSAFVVFTCHKIKMTLFNTKKKLTDYYFIERIFDRGTCRLVHREQRVVDGLGGEAKKIYAVGILSKYKASMCWVKIRERRLCPLTAYFGVLIELYTTEVIMAQKWNLAAVGFEPTPPKRLVP